MYSVLKTIQRVVPHRLLPVTVPSLRQMGQLQTVSRVAFTSGSTTTLSGAAGGLAIASPTYNGTGLVTTGTVTIPRNARQCYYYKRHTLSLAEM